MALTPPAAPPSTEPLRKGDPLPSIQLTQAFSTPSQGSKFLLFTQPQDHSGAHLPHGGNAEGGSRLLGW